MLTTKRIFRAFMLIILAIALIVGLYLAWYYWLRPLRTYDFTLENYTFFIEHPENAYDEVLGPIADANDAREKAFLFLLMYTEKIRYAAKSRSLSAMIRTPIHGW